MAHVEEPRRAFGAAGQRVIVDPDLPAKMRKTLGGGIPQYSGYTEDEASAFASLSALAILLSLPLGAASYWGAQHVTALEWLNFARPLLYGLGALITGAGALTLLSWGLFHGSLLIRPGLARLAFKRLAARHRDQMVTVGDLEAACRELGERAMSSVHTVLTLSGERSAARGAETKARLPRALWEIGQDLQKISDLSSPADPTGADPDENLVQQAVAAVTARIEAIEAVADELMEDLRQDEEVREAGSRAVAQIETDRRAALQARSAPGRRRAHPGPP